MFVLSSVKTCPLENKSICNSYFVNVVQIDLQMSTPVDVSERERNAAYGKTSRAPLPPWYDTCSPRLTTLSWLRAGLHASRHGNHRTTYFVSLDDPADIRDVLAQGQLTIHL